MSEDNESDVEETNVGASTQVDLGNEELTRKGKERLVHFDEERQEQEPNASEDDKEDTLIQV